MKNSEFEVRNIEKATLNGRNVKIFEIWRYCQNAKAWLFYERTSLPARVANKNLLSESNI